MFYTYDVLGRYSETTEIEKSRSTVIPPNEYTPDWNWNGVEWKYAPDVRVVPMFVEVVTVEDAKTLKLSELAAYRFTQETAGITLSGMTIETDRQSQALITGAWSFSQLNPAVLINWKGVNGWVQIDAATITAIAGSVAAHVQACFDAEYLHSVAINALTTSEEVTSYDITVGWPSNG